MSLLDFGKGTLFLSNHTSRLDPLFLFCAIPTRFAIRPVVVEYIYRIRFLRSLLKIVRAVPIPNFDNSMNGYKVKKAKEAIEKIGRGLAQGDMFLLYPSARLKKTAIERLGGTSGVHSLLQEHPDTNLVLIRITGLWGSRFSWGYDGKLPDLITNLKASFKALIRSGFFFMPRREIVIEIELAGPDFPRQGSRLEINRYLENWYNRYPGPQEPLKIIPYTPWESPPKPRNEIDEKKRFSSTPISEQLRNLVYREIRTILGQPDLNIVPEMDLSNDLGMDSLNKSDLFVILSETTKTKKFLPASIDTVQDLLEITAGLSPASLPKPISFKWPKEEKRLNQQIPLKDTIPEAFLAVCSRMGKSSAIADPILGPVSYRQLKKRAIMFAEHFRSFPDSQIAILLPASVTTYLLILSLQIAGKIPVMLNWTLGPSYLDEMIELTNIKVIISSWDFIDQVPNVNFGLATDRICFIEDMADQLSVKTKLKGLFLKPRIGSKPDDPAVIIFSSGTENAPKAIPLTHRNLLSNMKSVFNGFSFEHDEIVFSAAPPFHALGFSVLGIYPILLGIRTAYEMDPSDHFAIARAIDHWQATIYATSPIFLQGLLAIADELELKTLRIIVCVGEKMGNEFPLPPQIKRIGGYGVTECSPAIALGHPSRIQKGVGRILPGVKILILHPETKQILPYETEGEIAVAGPSVFHGYLGSLHSPFLEIDGEKWYLTQDLGYVDQENNLYLTGRLNRFVKIEGETIRLAALEQALSLALQEENDSASAIICPHESSDGILKLILFTTIACTPAKANEILQEKGFSSLIQVASAITLEEFPLTANGKINYREFSNLCKK